MVDALLHIATFTAQTIIIVAAIVVVLVVFFSLISRAKEKQELEVKSLNDHFTDLSQALRQNVLSKRELKSELKKERKEKKRHKDLSKNSRTYVIDFLGDIKASATEALREEVSAILGMVGPADEVVVRLESGGGMVHAYGLAASQLARVVSRKIPLTVCVDKVAASGGYMMACVANQILAAPFAIVGSIGVMAPVANVNRLLKKHDIDYNEMTAGEYKRTVSLFGEITEAGKAKFLEQLEETHALFKQFVSKYRGRVDIQKVATGEYWYGEQSLEIGLVDRLITSDDYLMEKVKTSEVFLLKYNAPRTITQKLSDAFEKLSTGLSSMWTNIRLQ